MNEQERAFYEQGLNDAIEITKGRYREYLFSCHGPDRECGHKQAADWIRSQIESLRDRKATLGEIVSPDVRYADSTRKE